MFEFIRSHTKILMAVLVLLIIPSFVLFGLEGYTQFNEQSTAVARVAGQKITQGEWDALHRQEADRVRAQAPNLDPAMLDSAEAKYGTLERMVRDRVLAAAAAKDRVFISDARLARELQNNPVIAELRGPDGKLDVERYKQLVGAQGMTPQMFEASVRNDLAASQVLQGVAGSTLLARAQSDLVLDRFFERREVQVLSLKPADFSSRVALTDADIKAFYDANTGLFQAPEKATVEYLVLDIEAVRNSITPSESDIAAYFQQNASLLAAKEERRASHILITAAKDAPADVRAKARAKAEELLAAVRKAPGTFADVARKNSQDPGSAERGGDLDFFARGAMVKPFEDAAFALQKGQISDVVESDFGFHIIRLTDIKSPPQPTLAESRDRIVADLRAQQAQARFAELAETFTNSVYEQADSLAPTAERLKLAVRKAEGVTRTPAAGASPALANAKLLEALFASDSIQRKRNTEAVEIGPSQLASARIIEHSPARALPLEEVRPQVVARLTAQKAAELARAEGESRLKALQAKPDAVALPAAVVVARDRPSGLQQQVISAVLRADADKLPAFIGVDLKDQGYVVARVVRTVPRDPVPAQQALQDQAQITRWWADAEARAYYDTLKTRLKARIEVPEPAAK